MSIIVTEYLTTSAISIGAKIKQLINYPKHEIREHENLRVKIEHSPVLMNNDLLFRMNFLFFLAVALLLASTLAFSISPSGAHIKGTHLHVVEKEESAPSFVASDSLEGTVEGRAISCIHSEQRDHFNREENAVMIQKSSNYAMNATLPRVMWAMILFGPAIPPAHAIPTTLQTIVTRLDSQEKALKELAMRVDNLESKFLWIALVTVAANSILPLLWPWLWHT
jgi:hypothetical protein